MSSFLLRLGEFMKKVIAILGATGSVGAQAADVAEKRGYADDFISANRDFKKTENQGNSP